MHDNSGEERPERVKHCNIVELEQRCAGTQDAKQIKAEPSAQALRHLQIPVGAGLIVSNSSSIMQNASGRIELVRSSRSRNLSIGDHSWTDSRRKTTTTPAKPASATATWATVLRASPGSIVTRFQPTCHAFHYTLMIARAPAPTAADQILLITHRLLLAQISFPTQ